MTNHGYPDDETALAVDDEGEPPELHEDPSSPSQSPDKPAEDPLHNEKAHSHGANDNELTSSRRSFLGGKTRGATESDSEEETAAPTLSAESESGSVPESETETESESGSGPTGFISDGLTQNELIAFISAFLGSYSLAGLFYWGMLSSGLEGVPTQMWILLGILVLAPLALMFGLQQTSGIASVILNRGSR